MHIASTLYKRGELLFFLEQQVFVSVNKQIWTGLSYSWVLARAVHAALQAFLIGKHWKSWNNYITTSTTISSSFVSSFLVLTKPGIIASYPQSLLLFLHLLDQVFWPENCFRSCLQQATSALYYIFTAEFILYLSSVSR